MSRILPTPDDSANDVERLKKTIDNKRKAEEAMKYAEGAELAAIQEKNERREEAMKNFGKY
ncbi:MULTISPECIES: small, acid-soluble spore protein tlp [Sporosarcina]|uniref:Small, acid-soluble spore protein tlp n=1 Tax=Sporosarcina saromensis TaxID=359365 RepID=A0ABU4GDL2_9BACL|nr:small, acid-soluble spore protein tlp [Sporosarcina saromensis]MDW0114467.1 small, acid-soluble spore protein tlp [Sporosarcina saromensis]